MSLVVKGSGGGWRRRKIVEEEEDCHMLWKRGVMVQEISKR